MWFLDLVKFKIAKEIGYNDNILLLDDNGHTFKCPSRCPAYSPEYICDLPVTNHPMEFKGVFRNLILEIQFESISKKQKHKNKVYSLISSGVM